MNWLHLMIFGLAICPESSMAKSSLMKDKICLPVGSDKFKKAGITDFEGSWILKSDFDFGDAKLLKGCEITFRATAGKQGFLNSPEMADFRAIASAQCHPGFMLANTFVSLAQFDNEGCVEPVVKVRKDVSACGEKISASQDLYFHNGKVICPQPKVPPAEEPL